MTIFIIQEKSSLQRCFYFIFALCTWGKKSYLLYSDSLIYVLNVYSDPKFYNSALWEP